MADTYSVLVTVRRTTVETAFISVPISRALVNQATNRLDGAAIMEEAVRLGAGDDVEWVLDGEPVIDLNPIQRPRPEDTLQ